MNRINCYKHPEKEANGICTVCGKAVCEDCSLNINGRITCPACAVNLASHFQPNAAQKKEPVLSALLSFLFVGLGQIYNGQVKKGIIIAISTYLFTFCTIIIIVIVSILTAGVGAICCMPIGFLFFVPVLYSMYDAYTVAVRINSGEVMADWLP